MFIFGDWSVFQRSRFAGTSGRSSIPCAKELLKRTSPRYRRNLHYSVQRVDGSEWCSRIVVVDG
ncbi:hypothetical protein U9M48_026948 [Paspalum notatum var. saurae]|uniref:Uncharacterized protein n=1 Tax=Paspalum notatum var. saurae TaxID=547442 RepID=A0AAQ3WYV2_PASNO